MKKIDRRQTRIISFPSKITKIKRQLFFIFRGVMQVASGMSSSLGLLEISDFCKYELLETMPGLLRYKTKVLMSYPGYWSF